MAQVTIDRSEADDFGKRFARLQGREQLAIMHMAADKVGVAFDQTVRGDLPPPVRRRPAARYWTIKQQRWWWATMHKKAQGKSQALPGWKAAYKKVEGRKKLVLSGAYKRTGTMIRTLAHRVEQTATATTVVYGTNRPYARYVIDREDQAKYHEGNWPTLQAKQEEFEPQARRIFEETVHQATERFLQG